MLLSQHRSYSLKPTTLCRPTGILEYEIKCLRILHKCWKRSWLSVMFSPSSHPQQNSAKNKTFWNILLLIRAEFRRFEINDVNFTNDLSLVVFCPYKLSGLYYRNPVNVWSPLKSRRPVVSFFAKQIERIWPELVGSSKKRFILGQCWTKYPRLKGVRWGNLYWNFT